VRESREPAPRMGRVSFVQTAKGRELFPVLIWQFLALTNPLADSSHLEGQLGIKSP
jgi:hypothetical protein